MERGYVLLNISKTINELCKILYLCNYIKKNDSPMSTNDKSNLEVPPMYQWSFLYNYWLLLCVPLYFLWLPILVCIFLGVPSIIVWLFLFFICICSLLQAINIHHALNNNDKPLALKMFLLQIIGIIIAIGPILIDIDYSIRYMVQHDIFSSFP